MSQYTFRIWFTGLMHFVQNKDPYARCQLCVVLPRAQDSTRRKHTGAIYEVNRELHCGKLRLQPGDPICLKCLERHRVAFKITRTDDIRPEPTASLTFPDGFLHLQDIAGIFADENDQIVSRNPPWDIVLAQILVEGGHWLGYDFDTSITRDWDIPQTLTGFPLTLWLADPVFVEIPNVEKVEILFYKMDEHDTLECSKVLTPGSNGFIEILAANSCRDKEGDECMLGLGDLDFQWMGGQHLQIRQIDQDFEYHYRLLHPATLEAIKKVLPKKHGVIPEEPRYPVPESPLVDVIVAPHICLEDVFKPTPGPEPAPAFYTASHGLEGSLEARAKQIVMLRFPDAGEMLIEFLVRLLVVILGTGTGSGNDCLGTKAQARFVGLDQYIPGPDPGVSMSVLHARAALERQMCFPPPSDPAYPFLQKPGEKTTETPPKQTIPAPKKE